MTAPVLAYPDFIKSFVLDSDRCDHSVGVVFSQYDEHRVEHSITYFSCTLLPRKKKYHITQKECLAMVEGMKHFWPYLWGRTFTVRTDHSSLQWLYKAKDGNNRLYRWFLKLAHDGYDYKVIHRPGKDHRNADAMSHLMCMWDRSETQEGEIVTLAVEEEVPAT